MCLFVEVASLIVTNLLVSELTDSQGGDSVGILLGMDYDKLLGHTDQTVRSKKEQRWCAIPWLICEALSVLSKLTGIVIHERSSKHTDNILVVTTSILFLGEY
ncbi:unnamed protein product, partial [Timema podura]|nr:unnamed protein product [Timema podura]